MREYIRKSLLTFISGSNGVRVQVMHPFLNRAYPENTNFENFIPRNLKFHTCGDLHTTKKCRKFQPDISNSLRVMATRKYNKHV